MYKVLLYSMVLTLALNATGQNTNRNLKQRLEPFAKSTIYSNEEQCPDYFEFKQGKEIEASTFIQWAKFTFELDKQIDFKLINTKKDQIGFVHFRYQQFFNDYPVENAILMVHTKNDKVKSFNGKIYRKITAATTASLLEKEALQYALKHMNAEKYKWESAADEKQLKEIQQNPNATYYPKGELVYVLKDDKNKKQPQYYLTYKFDIYASKPLKRVYSYVDANTGEIIQESNRIVHGSAVGSANTMYSGTQTIITDSIAPNQFRLRDFTRGGGIITLNDNNGTNDTIATDFTDTDNFWDDTLNHNNAAYDTHWATEGTYDFYFTKFNRNSIDDAGLPLYGYVHNDSLQENAFWDGNAMHYGDGNPNGTYHLPFVSADIIGHEITHGLTQYTAGLGDGEASALNESFSDIMGTAIEHFLKPNTANYILGEDIGTPIRSMENPGLYDQPTTYLGNNWDPFMEPHQNDGVQNYWFYLLAEGGTGTNDNGDNYTVTGIGIDKAAQIAFRNLTVYLTPTSGYNDAKLYSIIAAQDLFGTCSNEAIQTANAWHAVGIGVMIDSTTVSNFSLTDSIACYLPATFNFNNLSSLTDSVLWNFGDGTTSSASAPSHSYQSFGTYTVSLIAYGSCTGLPDTLIKTNYITIDSNLNCPVLIPASDSLGVFHTNKCSGTLLDNGGYGNYTAGEGMVTIAPTGAQNVILSFSSFDFYDAPNGLYIYDGADSTAPLIGFYTSVDLPNGGSIVSSGPALTIKQYTPYANSSGFVATWNCYQSGNPPYTYFSTADTFLCGFDSVHFNMVSAGATSWLWDFGDGSTSTLQVPPPHIYSSAGSYNVKLVAQNQFGSDSLVRINYITIDTASNCHYNMPVSGTQVLSFCHGKLMDSGGEGNYLDQAYGATVIAPTGATTITLNFLSFNYVDSTQYEGIVIFDGTSSNTGTYIGTYGGSTLPNGGTIVSTSPAITIYEYTNFSNNSSGFELTWTCNDINSGITKINSKNHFNVFPNPANDYVQINVSGSDIKSAEIELTDLLGNRLMVQKPSFSNNAIDYKLDISGIANGLYLLKIKTNTSDYIQKIIKS